MSCAKLDICYIIRQATPMLKELKEEEKSINLADFEPNTDPLSDIKKV